MLVLLPPSEGKAAEPGTGTFRDLSPEFVEETDRVLQELRRLRDDERLRAYAQKDPKKAALIHDLNMGVLEAPCMKALERYTGVVYTHFDYASLRRGGKRRAEARIAIVSGLFGLIRGGTAIPNYKLPISTRLADRWQPENDERLRGWSKGKPAVSLLPKAHRRAVGCDDLVHVEFMTEGGRRSAGHGGKAIKGRFARYLIEHDVRTVEAFEGFTEDGYRFDGRNFVQS